MPETQEIKTKRSTQAKWETKKLSEICAILDNKRKPINSSERENRISGKSQNSLFPYYGATGQVGFIDDYLLEGEYVLLGEDGAPFLESFKDKAYLVNGKIWVNNHAHILNAHGSNKFLCYYLNQIDYHEFVSGTTRLKLNQSMMREIPVLSPPLPEQHRIVEKIEELFSELDNAITTLKTTQQQLQTYRQSVLKHAFEGHFTGGIDGWDIVELGQTIAKIEAGKSFRCEERPPLENEYGVLKVSAVTWGEYDEDESKTVLEKSKINDSYLVKKNDFLFSRANTIELVGACVIVKNTTKALMLSDKTLRIIFNDNILPYYALYYLKSKKARTKLKSYQQAIRIQ